MLSKTHLPLTVWVIVCLMVTACSPTRKIAVTIRQSPEIVIPGNNLYVAVVNNVASKASSKTYVETEFLYSGASRDGSNAIADMICSVLKKSEQFDTLVVYYKGSDVNERQTPRDIQLLEAEALCNELIADAVFIIDYFYADLKRDVSELSETTDDGKPIFEAVMTGRVEASVTVFYYDSDKKLVAVTPMFFGGDVSTGARGESRSDAKSALGTSRTFVDNWGSDVGRSIAGRFIANDYSVKRAFFVEGHDSFKSAFIFLKDGNTAKAEEILLPCLSSPDKGISDRARYNLAVVAEVSGDRTRALKLLENLTLKEAYSYKSSLKALQGW